MYHTARMSFLHTLFFKAFSNTICFRNVSLARQSSEKVADSQNNARLNAVAKAVCYGETCVVLLVHGQEWLKLF